MKKKLTDKKKKTVSIGEIFIPLKIARICKEESFMIFATFAILLFSQSRKASNLKCAVQCLDSIHIQKLRKIFSI